jgi:hypothetical protein
MAPKEVSVATDLSCSLVGWALSPGWRLGALEGSRVGQVGCWLGTPLLCHTISENPRPLFCAGGGGGGPAGGRAGGGGGGARRAGAGACAPAEACGGGFDPVGRHGRKKEEREEDKTG